MRRAAVANVVILPMALLSGTSVDVSAAPEWVQTVSRVFPLRWMTDGMLDVLVHGQGHAAIWLSCLVLAGFTVVVAVVANAS